MAKEKKVRIQVMVQPRMLHLMDQICEQSQMARSSLIEIAVFELFKKFAGTKETKPDGEKA